MIVYAESSAVLAWLLAEPAGNDVALALQDADHVIERSRQPFPVEPVRSLDAIHLASALHVRPALPDMQVLSLDGRVRGNALKLGFEVLPASDGQPSS